MLLTLLLHTLTTDHFFCVIYYSIVKIEAADFFKTLVPTYHHILECAVTCSDGGT
jgi:hypothetical protein